MQSISYHHNPVALIILTLVRYFLVYMSYNPLAFFLIICFFYLVYIAINVTGGDFRLLGFDTLVNLFNLERFEDVTISYTQTDFIAFLGRISLIMFVISGIFSYLLKRITKREISITLGTKIKIGLVFITGLLLGALISNYVPRAMTNAPDMWWMLIIFWVIGVMAYFAYTALINLAGGIMRLLIFIQSSLSSIPVQPQK